METMLKRWASAWLPARVKRFLRRRQSLRFLARAARRALRIVSHQGPPAQGADQEGPTAVSDARREADRWHQQYLEAERRRQQYLEDCQREISDFAYRPLISIVVPIYNTPLDILAKTIASVERQIYPEWELCVVDDCSTDEFVRMFLQGIGERDPRIRVMFRSVNGHISDSTNDGIRMARGEYVAFLDHDDELTEDALLHMVRLLNDKPETDVVYSDNDRITTEGAPIEPFFKPDWSPEYFRGAMYMNHLMMARRSLLLDVAGCDSRFNGIQDYELELRLSEKTNRIEHVPLVLYHWRAMAGSVAADRDAKPNIDFLQERAVQAHLDRLGIPASAMRLGGHRVRLQPLAKRSRPLISILIPTRDRPELIGRCLHSIYARTAHEPFEVIVGDNDTSDPEALALLERYPVKRVPLPGPFHFARFNNEMARFAQGEFLVLLNNDTEILYPDWLDHLLLYAEQPDVAAVGPLLLYPDGRVQHAGVILGPRGTADHVMRGFPAHADGYAGSLRCTREVSAVTGACLMVRKDKYLSVGGLNEFFARHYEDVDFCLRLRRRNWRNVYVGGAALIHHESMTRGPNYNYTDRVLLLDHWEPLIQAGDPYYNRNFDPLRVDYALKG